MVQKELVEPVESLEDLKAFKACLKICQNFIENQCLFEKIIKHKPIFEGDKPVILDI